MITETEAEALSPADEAALALAVETMRRKGPTESRRIDQMLARGDAWEDVARYCAFHCQVERLNLPPWLVAPCDVVDIASALAATDDRSERTGLRAAGLLLQRMLGAGLSRYDPDPLRALRSGD